MVLEEKESEYCMQESFSFSRKERDFTLLSNYKNFSPQKLAYHEIGQYLLISWKMEEEMRTSYPDLFFGKLIFKDENLYS